MNLLFTICGRAGSKGLKNKNLKSFLGIPLVYYTLAAIRLYQKQYGNIDTIQVCLNSDSDELIQLVLAWEPAVFVIRREAELAGDLVAKTDVFRDCLRRAEQYYDIVYDMLIDLDITSPLRTLEDISNAVSKKAKQTNTDVVFSVTNSRRNPYFNMVKRDKNGFISKVIDSKYVTRQQAPEVFDMNASIYAISAEFLRSSTSMLFDGVVDIVHMLDTAVLDIDSEEDFELMQIVAEYFLKRNSGLIEIRKEAFAGLHNIAREM